MSCSKKDGMFFKARANASHLMSLEAMKGKSKPFKKKVNIWQAEAFEKVYEDLIAVKSCDNKQRGNLIRKKNL